MTETTQDTVEEAVVEEQPSLDLKDLAVSLKLLDAAVQRGAFKTNELVTVGENYEKISKFLQYQAKQQQAAKDAAEKGEADG